MARPTRHGQQRPLQHSWFCTHATQDERQTLANASLPVQTKITAAMQLSASWLYFHEMQEPRLINKSGTRYQVLFEELNNTTKP